MEIKNIKFNRTSSGQVLFDEHNLNLLREYVIPIIEHNRGWSSEHINEKEFFENPENYREDIDATVEVDINAEIYIALEDKKPLGLLEYVVEDLDNLDNPSFQNILNDLRNDLSSKYWNKFIELGVIANSTFAQYAAEFNSFLEGKMLYKYVGVVLRPELQGKKTGISDSLYNLMKNGFVLGWTSTPLVLSKRKKVYSSTVFFPRLGEQPRNLEEFSCVVVASARLLSTEINASFEFGVKTLDSFALRDKDETLALAAGFLKANKISDLDFKRLEYTLCFPRGQAMVVSLSY